MGHLECSCFPRRTASGSWLRAYRGKGRDSTGSRPAFDWFCPLLSTGTEDLPPIQILHTVWDLWSRRNAAPLQYVTIDFSTGLKMSGQQIGGVLKELFSTSLGTSQAALLTSYCWRRVASTLADTYRSSVVQVNPFGGWAGAYARTDARQLKEFMAHRYCGRRAV